ncbi:uncharacterized protein LOC142635848 [Castanea sativa]|uniref:uncharacterized protein LOC142635848 n=1 Tax=Castanea sativa TaxID=21020 RepID=UPI003F64CADD
MGHYRESLHHERFECHNAAMDAMSRALRRAAQSLFSDVIKRMEMQRRFTRPPFTIYDGKIDLVEHVSHYIQMMSPYSHNDGLMCKVLLFSLRQTTMTWFNGLRNRVYPKFWGIDASVRYWELYNEIGGGNERVAASTFQLGLLKKLEVRDSLTMRPPEGMQQLMRRIEEYKRLEDDRLQRTKRELRAPGKASTQRAEGVSVTFKEPVYKILERIKNEPYFRWLGKMGGDPVRRNQRLYCTITGKRVIPLSSAVVEGSLGAVNCWLAKKD